MLHHVKDLSPEQRRAVENLIGRPVTEEEAVSIKSIRPSVIIPPQASPAEREETLERLRRYFIRVDAQRGPVSEAEEDEIINEALRAARSGYRPIS